MEVDRNGLEVLDRAECLRLLDRATLGRIGVTSGALPAVFPVNFLLNGDQILLLTAEGSKLDAATRNAVVAFEADDFDPMYHSGWSVLVTGVAREITDSDELAALRHAPLARWAHNGVERLMAISADMISGRRIVPGLDRNQKAPR
ncbi:MAG: pyridoxamine 5'-phosphate oxidase family protein [Acidimicrobiales bacterium]